MEGYVLGSILYLRRRNCDLKIEVSGMGCRGVVEMVIFG